MAKFKWSTKRRAYIYGNGRAVSSSQLQQWAKEYAGKTSDAIGALTERYIAGELTKSAWASEVRREIKDSQRVAVMLANGGRAQMNQSLWGKSGVNIREQYKYFSRFVDSIGSPPPAAIIARARLYGAAFYPAFIEQIRRREREAGAELERSTITAAENCLGCVEEAARGWVAMGSLIPIGARACLVNCRCEYETSARADS